MQDLDDLRRALGLKEHILNGDLDWAAAALRASIPHRVAVMERLLAQLGIQVSQIDIRVVVKIRVPFRVPIIVRHLLFGVPKKGP